MIKKLLSCCLLNFSVIILTAQSITVNGGTTGFELIDLHPVVALHLPLTIKRTDLSNLKFPDKHPAFVQLGSYSEDRFRNAITVTFDKMQSALRLVVSTDSLDLQGIYTINMRYSTDNLKTFSLLTFNLIRAAATLESLNTVTVTDEQFRKLRCNGVVIHETSNRCPVRDIKFYDPVLPDAKTEGLLKFPGISYIGAGEQKNFAYIVNHTVLADIPLGTSTGKLYFGSKMLSSPIPVIFVVTRKLWKGWIIILVLAGLVTGYFVRVVLATHKDNESVAATGYALIKEIQDFVKIIDDDRIKGQLNDKFNEVESIIKKNKNPVIPNQAKALGDIQTIQAAFNQIKQDFQSSVFLRQTELSDVYAALNHNNLDDTVKRYLQPVADLVPAVKRAIDSNSPARAVVELNALYEKLESRIEAYIAYFSTMTGYLSTTTNYPKQALTTIVNIPIEATSLLATLQLAIVDRTNISVVIIKINDNHRFFAAVSEDIKDNIKVDFLKSKKFPPDGQFTVSLDEWLQLIDRMIDNPDLEHNVSHYLSDALSDNPNLIVNIENEWKQAAAPLKTIDMKNLMNIAQFIPGNNISLLKPPAKIEQAMLLKFTSQVWHQTNTLTQLKNSKKSYFFLSFAQTTILAVIISLGAYKSLEAEFIGRYTEMIGIYLFAFSLDISVGTVGQFKN